MAERGSPRASADGKLADENAVSSTELHRAQLQPDAPLPSEPEYDDETVERVYRKLDMRIIPGELNARPTRICPLCPPGI